MFSISERVTTNLAVTFGELIYVLVFIYSYNVLI